MSEIREGEELLQALHHARGLLRVHGCLPDKENSAVARRIERKREVSEREMRDRSPHPGQFT